MNNIKFGLKIWSKNYNLIPEAKRLIDKDIFHYVELLIVPGTEISPFRRIKLPYIIHIAHDNFGVNISDREKEAFNLGVINNCIEWADMLNAKYLILHPGFGKIETTKKFLEKINDKRILIENMPMVGLNNEKMIGYTPEQVKELKENKFGFCLDFGHAIKAAISLKKDYKKFIKEFLKLNPKILHIADGTFNSGKDEHLNIGEGEYDFNFLKECLEKSNIEYITMETPRTNLNSLKEDLENLKKLKSILFF